MSPLARPVGHYLEAAVHGHHEIVAAIANHAEDFAERRDQIGELGSGAALPGG